MENNSYRATGGGRGGSSALTYDATTGKWVPSSNNDSNGKTQSSSSPKKSSGADPSDSKAKADKAYIEAEMNTLEGELTVTSSEKSISIKINDTVKLQGLGKYLSGVYLVVGVKRTLDKDSGYTQTLTLIRNGFGDSLKSSPKEPPRKEEVKKESPAFNAGDKVHIVGDNATYSNASAGVKVPGWVKKKELTIAQVSKDGTRVRLDPINSWTYISNISK